MKNPKPWWHKKWDKTFECHLYETAVITPKTHVSFNDMAKREIQEIIDFELKEQLAKYNLYANAQNQKLDNPLVSKQKIESLINHFAYEAKKMSEIKESLIKIKKSI